MANFYDWVTLDEGKRALDVKSTITTSDDVISMAISALSQRLDNGVGPAVVRTVSDEVYNGGWRSIELRRGPVASISSVIEYQNGAAVTLTSVTPGVGVLNSFYAEPYLAQPELGLLSGMLYRRDNFGGSPFWCGAGNVVVTYTAGRYTSTSSVEPRFKEAAKVSLKNWYRMYQQGIRSVGEMDVPAENFPRFAIPNAARMMLHDVWTAEVGFGA